MLTHFSVQDTLTPPYPIGCNYKYLVMPLNRYDNLVIESKSFPPVNQCYEFTFREGEVISSDEFDVYIERLSKYDDKSYCTDIIVRNKFPIDRFNCIEGTLTFYLDENQKAYCLLENAVFMNRKRERLRLSRIRFHGVEIKFIG